MPGSPRSQHGQSDMDIDPAAVATSTPEYASLPSEGQGASEHAAAHSSMQPDAEMHSIAPSQQQQQHHQQQVLNGHEGRSNSHVASATGLSLHHIPQAAGSHGYGAEATIPPQQTSTSHGHSFASAAAQMPGFASSTTQLPGFVPNPGSQSTRQSTATGPRHGHGEEEDQGAAPLQHASSTSAMLSLAQQASQASWTNHQQAAKRHSRHTGQHPAAIHPTAVPLQCAFREPLPVIADNCSEPSHMSMSFQLSVQSQSHLCCDLSIPTAAHVIMCDFASDSCCSGHQFV